MGANTTHEYFPLWMTHLIAPYQPVPGFQLPHLSAAQGAAELRYDDGRGGELPRHQPVHRGVPKNLTRVYATSNPDMAKLARWLVEKMYYASGDVPHGGRATATPTAGRCGPTSSATTPAGSRPRAPAALGLQKNKCFAYGQCFFRDGWTHDGTSSLVTLYASPWQWTAPAGIHASGARVVLNPLRRADRDRTGDGSTQRAPGERVGREHRRLSAPRRNPWWADVLGQGRRQAPRRVSARQRHRESDGRRRGRSGWPEDHGVRREPGQSARGSTSPTTPQRTSTSTSTSTCAAATTARRTRMTRTPRSAPTSSARSPTSNPRRQAPLPALP